MEYPDANVLHRVGEIRQIYRDLVELARIAQQTIQKTWQAASAASGTRNGFSQQAWPFRQQCECLARARDPGIDEFSSENCACAGRQHHGRVFKF